MNFNENYMFIIHKTFLFLDDFLSAFFVDLINLLVKLNVCLTNWTNTKNVNKLLILLLQHTTRGH